jgi:hypothetical protein
MIWIILAGLIGLGYGTYLEGIGCGTFFAIIGAIFGFLPAMVVGEITSDVHTITKPRVALVNLADGGSELHGSFFLGSGTVNSNSVYTWYESSGENAYVQRNVNANHATIHFLKRGERPYYLRHTTVNDAKPGLKTWRAVLDDADDYYDTYDFFVPRGTIKHNYILDAQ